MPKLSVILPCYNPPADWLKTVYQGWKFVQNTYPDSELIIVNDGSSVSPELESALQTIKNWSNTTVISYSENKGKGYALRKGVDASRGDWVIYTDIDFPYTDASFIKVANALNNGAETVIGVRSEEYYTHLPAVRVRISKTLRWFIKIFLRIPTDDTQCGLKGFNSKGKHIFLQTSINRYLFDLEFVFLSAKRNLNINTVNVQLRPDVKLSIMNWKILLQEGGNFLKIFLKAL